MRADTAEVDRIRRFFASLGGMQRDRAGHRKARRLTRHDSCGELTFKRIESAAASALRDYRSKLAAAGKWQTLFDERSASITWRTVVRISGAGARFRPQGSKRRRLLRFGYRAVRPRPAIGFASPYGGPARIVFRSRSSHASGKSRRVRSRVSSSRSPTFVFIGMFVSTHRTSLGSLPSERRSSSPR